MRARPRGYLWSGSQPVSVTSTSSPVWRPARSSGVMTYGWRTTVMPAANVKSPADGRRADGADVRFPADGRRLGGAEVRFPADGRRAGGADVKFPADGRRAGGAAV